MSITTATIGWDGLVVGQEALLAHNDFRPLREQHAGRQRKVAIVCQRRADMIVVVWDTVRIDQHGLQPIPLTTYS